MNLIVFFFFFCWKIKAGIRLDDDVRDIINDNNDNNQQTTYTQSDIDLHDSDELVHEEV